MANNEGVDTKTRHTGSLKCQESDKKDISSETFDIKENVGNLGPSLCPIGIGSMSNSEHC